MKDLLRLIKSLDGKAYVKFEKGYPYYSCGCKDGGRDTCIKGWELWGNYYVSVRKRNVKGFSQYGREIIYTIFGNNCQINRFRVVADNNAYFMDMMRWALNKDMRMVKGHPNVMYNVKTRKYYGFSHRGHMGFGIGDTLFDVENENEDFYRMYCTNKAFRKSFIKTLKFYDRKNDGEGFYSLIKGGISAVVPFCKRGTKVITSREEAIKAAENLSEYLS